MHPPEGTAKLADFGLATRLAGAPLRSPLDLAATSSSLAFHSLGLGSRGFTPPERLRPLLRTPGVGAEEEAAEAAEDEAVGAHDVFSLGVLSHLVLCASRRRMALALPTVAAAPHPHGLPPRGGPGHACSPVARPRPPRSLRGRLSPRGRELCRSFEDGET